MVYKKLAKYYDDFIYDVDYEKIAKFYKNRLEKNGINVISALELACGTGNITEKLKGYNIYAIDNSEEMLTVARNKLRRSKNISFYNMDMRSFHFNKKFEFVFSGLDGINYILEEADVLKTFENVYAHLNEDGIFIFDINSKYKIEKFIANNIFTDEIEDSLYIWQSEYDKNLSINTYNLTVFVEDDDGRYERFSESHREKVYEKEDIINLLNKSGFKDVQIFDDYSDKIPDDETMRIVFEAKKG